MFTTTVVGEKIDKRCGAVFDTGFQNDWISSTTLGDPLAILSEGRDLIRPSIEQRR
jgi:hypothetical protein